MEKKNNKGITIVVIVILIICLIAILYCMLQLALNPQNNTKSNNQEKKDETITELKFKELTKYEIQDEEKKEITVNGQTIILEKRNGKIYFNDKEVGDNYDDIYVTNQVILFGEKGQYGDLFKVYNLVGDLVDDINRTEIYYNELSIEEEKLYAIGYQSNFSYDEKEKTIHINNVFFGPCGFKGRYIYSIEKYKSLLEENEKEDIKSKYEIQYKNNQLNYKYISSIYAIKDYLNENTNLCISK